MTAALGFVTFLGIAAAVVFALTVPLRRRGSWFLVTKIGVEYGPFRTREQAEAYPNSFWGCVADGPAFRRGWHVEDRGEAPAAPVGPPRPDLSPSELYARSGKVPSGRVAEILALADESHHRFRRLPRETPNSGPGKESPLRPMSDEAVLRMLGGATFGPNASPTLPSGRRLDAGEAQALTSYYADPADEENDR